MIKSLKLSTICGALNGALAGNDAEFDRVSTDTRTLQANDLYIALVGENFDGNDYVSAAKDAGACGAIISKPTDIGLPSMRVVDTKLALGQLAKLNRNSSSARLIAITGSQGKTTVKELTGAILQQAGSVLSTKGNLNNDIGAPLTLLNLDEEHEFAVIELGASSAGEIAYTVALAKPDIALITNASISHIEGFGSLQGIVETKGEIIDGLALDGVLIVNADDANSQQWIKRAGSRKLVTFSLHRKENQQSAESSFGNDDSYNSYFSEDLEIKRSGGISFTLHSPDGSVVVNLKLMGLHNVVNALAAAAASMEAGASLHDVQEGLASVAPIKGRMYPYSGLSDSLIIDDSYNASPASFRAAIDVLSHCNGIRILVVGDMGELGEVEESAHRELGEYADKKGVDKLFSVGRLSELSSSSFGEGGVHFENQQQLIAECKKNLGNETTCLIKGSRSANMEFVVKELIKEAS